MHSTKQLLLEAGLKMLLERGYNDLGIQAVLDATGMPKGSFYHHFESKEDFALPVVDMYMHAVHQGLDACLADAGTPPLQRVRNFFSAVRGSYEQEGYLGCMLGGVGQELAGVNEVFRRKIEACFLAIGARLEGCLSEARERGELPANTDPQQLSRILVNCWEGAALRSRLQRSPAPLDQMLDFYFRVAAQP